MVVMIILEEICAELRLDISDIIKLIGLYKVSEKHHNDMTV